MTERETEVEDGNSSAPKNKDGVNETLELVPGEPESATVTSHSKKKNKRKNAQNEAGKASRVAQWLRALYCSASCAIRDSGFAPRLCRNRPRPGGPRGDARLA